MKHNRTSIFSIIKQFKNQKSSQFATYIYFLGIKAYLNKHKYKNTQTEDLWKAFEDASGKPVGKHIQI